MRILQPLILFRVLPYTLGWTASSLSSRIRSRELHSTRSDTDSFFANPYSPGGASPNTSVPRDTRLVVGLNKYSHDTSICAADAKTGKVLFALSKERITRRKHDSGNVASLVEACLKALDLDLDAIETVVMNNHHHRILPMEANTRHMEWESGLRINGGGEDGYDDPENLLLTASRREMSHHLAHAYSTAAQAPFDKGLCVVMDGMGETYKGMLRAELNNETAYTSDLTFGLASFQCIPADIHERAKASVFDWREAESVYVFEKSELGIKLRPIFKRFTEENSPPTLYNHGFENMDSVGALYSRASSHIFGDWNACGKVMGLAPWATHKWIDENGYTVTPKLFKDSILSGRIYDGSLIIDRTLLDGTPSIARNDPELFTPDGEQKKRYDFDDHDFSSGKESGKRLPVKVAMEAISLAHRIQLDLETTLIDLVKYFKELTGEANVCLAGGVALNSVLNGRISRELGFEQVFISPYPGDDGIAVGCCAFGLFGNSLLDVHFEGRQKSRRPTIWSGPLSPYLGPDPLDNDIKEAIEEAEPWLTIEPIRDLDERLTVMVEEIESGGVVAWYHSRSEMGPRALGHRSILADPRKKGLVRFINQSVKSRETFRPFAPSVLVEEAGKWFDLGPNVVNDNVSPYMSLTAMVRKDKQSQIPAVTHVDGSSRLQTVAKEAEPLYHMLISKFFELTGVPLVLNTSFNTLPNEPIVESPRDAIRSFLYSLGAIEMLVIGEYVVKRKKPDLRRLLGEATKAGDLKIEPACPKRTGRAEFQTSYEVAVEPSNDEDIETTTKVRMPDRPMQGDRNEWFELMDELEGQVLSLCDGSATLNEIMAFYTAVPVDKALGPDDVESAENLLQNIVQRLVRLYEHTLISW